MKHLQEKTQARKTKFFTKCAVELPKSDTRKRHTGGVCVFVCECWKEKRGEGVMGEASNCGGLVAPIHTTDLILL